MFQILTKAEAIKALAFVVFLCLLKIKAGFWNFGALAYLLFKLLHSTYY